MTKPEYAPNSYADNRRYLDDNLKRIIKVETHVQGMKHLQGIEKKLERLDEVE